MNDDENWEEMELFWLTDGSPNESFEHHIGENSDNENGSPWLDVFGLEEDFRSTLTDVPETPAVPLVTSRQEDRFLSQHATPSPPAPQQDQQDCEEAVAELLSSIKRAAKAAREEALRELRLSREDRCRQLMSSTSFSRRRAMRRLSNDDSRRCARVEVEYYRTKLELLVQHLVERLARHLDN